MKKYCILVMLAALVLAVNPGRLTAQNSTKESVTVVRPTPGGGAQIISKEVTSEDAEKASRNAQNVPTDTTPRKARLVVVPAIYAPGLRQKAARELNERFGITDPTILENPGFTSHLVDALVNTRKFDVLEREDLRSVIKELDFGESEYADLAKVVKLGKMANADYVVIPEIRVFIVVAETRQVPYVGQTQDKLRGKFGTTVRTVDVATGKIVASNLEDLDKYARVRKRDVPAMVLTELITSLYTDTAIREAAKIIDVAYPIRIMAINGDEVILNRGRGAIVKDEILKIYSIGEVMIDPDTKENLGYNETCIGTVKVYEVNEKICKAKILSKTSPIQRLAICRREREPSTDENLPVQRVAPKID